MSTSTKTVLAVGAIALALIVGPRFWWFHYRLMTRIGIYVEQYDQPLQHNVENLRPAPKR